MKGNNMKELGLDLGFGNVKIFDNRGSTVHASHLAAPGIDYDADEGQDNNTAMIEFSGVRYAVGEYAFAKGSEIAGLGMARLLGSTEVRAITYAALGSHFAKYGRPRDGLSVYVGLPAELLTKAEKTATTEAVTGWLTGRHEWCQDGKPVWAVVDSVTVRSQAAGAMYDMVHTKDGGQTKDAQYATGNIGIISIGYNTVELSGMLLGKASDAMMASDTYGVRRLLESYNSRGIFKLSMLDAQLRSNQLNGDFSSIKQAWSDRVLGFADTIWGKNTHALKRVIAVGGGVQYARPGLEKMFGDRLWVPENHIFAISRGLYKQAVADGKKA
jgi:hypothetical protein